MRLNFTIYQQDSPGAPVQFFCDTQLVHEKASEVLVESPRPLSPLKVGTYIAQKPTKEGTTVELTSISFVPFQGKTPIPAYIGTYGKLIQEVPADWVPDS